MFPRSAISAELKTLFFSSYVCLFFYFILNNYQKDAPLSKVIPLFDEHSFNLSLPLCPDSPPSLVGRVNISRGFTTLTEVEMLLRHENGIMIGGRYRPLHCQARHKVAIVIPYRDRDLHLALLLANLHPFLQRQELAYTIFVVEQTGNPIFNRGMIKNIGFMEALHSEYFECVIFHDVDLLPEDDYNSYRCPKGPQHMAFLIDKYGYKQAFEDYFGGVVAFPTADFFRINGYSNRYWKWGGEDDDLLKRVRFNNISIVRPAETNRLRYQALYHKRHELNEQRWDLLDRKLSMSKYDGLSTLKYSIISIELRTLFTHVLAKV